MERKLAVRIWREVSQGAPDGVPTSRTLHEFAQRVEALAIAGCDKRHAAEIERLRDLLREARQEIANPACNHDSGMLMLDLLERIDAAVTPNV